MKKFALLLVLLLFIVGCEDDTLNPVPTTTSIEPSSMVLGHETHELTVRGSDFTEESKIYFNDQEKDTQYISDTELKCTLTAAELSLTPDSFNEGEYTKSIPVYVHTPEPGGGNSEVFYFSLNIYPHTDTESTVYTLNAQVSPLIVIDNNGLLYTGWGLKETLDDFLPGKYLSRSEDEGRTWSSTPLLAGYRSENAELIDIFVNSENCIYLIGKFTEPFGAQGIGIYYQVSSDISFQYFYKLSDNTVGKASDDSSLSISLIDHTNYFYVSTRGTNHKLYGDIWRMCLYRLKSSHGYTSDLTDVNISVGKTSMIKAVNGDKVIIYDAAYCSGYDKRENNRVYSIKSSDEGETWSEPKIVSRNILEPADEAKSSSVVLLPSGKLGVVYLARIDNGYGIYYTSLSNVDGTWDYPVKVCDADESVGLPRLAYDDNENLFVAVSLTGDTGNIYIAKSIDSGKTWYAPLKITDYKSGKKSNHPWIAIKNNVVYLVWSEILNSTGVNTIQFVSLIN